MTSGEQARAVASILKLGCGIWLTTAWLLLWAARERFQYEMEEDLTAITCPVLAVPGNKEVQVNPEHVRLFAEKVNGPAQAKCKRSESSSKRSGKACIHDQA